MRLFYKVIVVVFIFCSALITVLFFLQRIQDRPDFTTGCFEENCFLIEMANTAEKRTRGLMFREDLSCDEGMLFVFPETGVYDFWMKNTFVSLDIIWLNQEKEVVFIEKNVQPCRDNSCPVIRSEMLAKYVLEIKGGRAEEIGLKIGDKFSFEF